MKLKNEITFLFSSLLLIAEELHEISLMFLKIDIKYFLYILIFYNVVFSLYKFLNYKKLINKKELDKIKKYKERNEKKKLKKQKREADNV